MLGATMSDHPPPFPLPRGVRPRCGCELREPHVDPAPCVVLTGGPGAGKTAVLEVVQRQFCEHVVVLPEAATIVFSGGFPRYDDTAGRRGAQLAIFHVQDQMERLELALARAALVVCDRGIPDGAAYWPAEEESFWAAVGAPKEAVVQRYHAVIHLRTPAANGGYGHQNPVRIETPAEARAIDERIARIWDGHPRRVFVNSTDDFLAKIQTTLDHLMSFVPPCCRHG
jgi:predicted ATPase